MRRITHVGSSLVVDAHSKEGDKRRVDEHRYNRVKDGCDEHDRFA